MDKGTIRNQFRKVRVYVAIIFPKEIPSIYNMNEVCLSERELIDYIACKFGLVYITVGRSVVVRVDTLARLLIALTHSIALVQEYILFL